MDEKIIIMFVRDWFAKDCVCQARSFLLPKNHHKKLAGLPEVGTRGGDD